MKLRLNTVLKYFKKNYLNLAHILSPQYIYIYIYTHTNIFRMPYIPCILQKRTNRPPHASSKFIITQKKK